MLIRESGTANPEDSGHGFLFDNISLSSGPIPTVTLSAPTLSYPVNGTITTSAGLTSVGWDSVTDSVGGITYIYQSSNSSTTNPDGSFVTPAYTSGVLTATNIPTPGTPAGVYYWHVQAKDANGNTSPWSSAWMFTINNASPQPLATCPEGTNPKLVETDTVNSNSSTPTVSTNNLAGGQVYLLVASGTWQNSGINLADAAYASVDSWTTYMQGYNITPYFLGSNEFQLQVGGSFVNWGTYQPSHQYAYLYTGTGGPASFLIFDGDSSGGNATPNTGWYGDNSGNLQVSVYSCSAPIYVTTDSATSVTVSDATLNAMNDDYDATGHSFWISTSTFSTSTPNIPSGVYSTPDFGAISSSTAFSAPLSLVTTNAVTTGAAREIIFLR